MSVPRGQEMTGCSLVLVDLRSSLVWKLNVSFWYHGGHSETTTLPHFLEIMFRIKERGLNLETWQRVIAAIAKGVLITLKLAPKTK